MSGATITKLDWVTTPKSVIMIALGWLAVGIAYPLQAAPLAFDIPAQSLVVSLQQLGRTAGLTIAVDASLVQGLNAPALQGRMEPTDALQRLLDGHRLKSIVDGSNVIIERMAILPSAETLKKNSTELPTLGIQLDAVTVRAKRFQNVGPMPGLLLTKDQIAGNIQSISAKEIKEAHSLSLSDLLNSKLQSINVNDYQGNPFQMDVTYRGFTASPQLGSPQGLSVFLDGIRVNEAFGDIVNWDMIPMNALAGFDLIPGSNPLFGLNTLGGALTMKTKSGFDSAGVSADVLTGSFGRKQFQGSAGWNNGTLAAFGSVNLFMEDGWRQNSPSKVNQAFGKVEWQGEKLSLGLSSLAVVNKLVGNGTVPQELYREEPTAVFTSPDETNNRLLQFQVTAAFDFNDQINMTGQIYNRNSNRKSNTGDILDRETFMGTRDNYAPVASRRALPGEQVTCALGDTNKDGIPDYYLIPEADTSTFMINNPNFFQGVVPVQTGLNAALPAEVTANLKNVFRTGLIDVFLNYGADPDPVYPIGGSLATFMRGPSEGFVFTDAGTTYRMFAAPPVNLATCIGEVQGFKGGSTAQLVPFAGIVNEPLRARDGARNEAYSGTFGSGVVEGTPNAVITKSNIQQSGQGAAAQLNFNFDQHKAMFGISIDRARSSYVGKQRFGQIDEDRNVYNDPSSLGSEYYAADHDIIINDFSGKSSTRSLYASETWSPVKSLNLSVSGRYNYTNIKNTLAPKMAESYLDRLNNQFAAFMVCPGNDISNCPYSLSSPIDFVEFYKSTNDTSGFYRRTASQLSDKQTEKFSYHSLNPAIGATWQARPNLNIYANWNQGTRAPSVIELGCAYDDTLVPLTDTPGSVLVPRSIKDRRGCSLPSALSGDPYLPQVKARTIEAGARGKFKDFLEWNISAYRTEVTDDIYFNSVKS